MWMQIIVAAIVIIWIVCSEIEISISRRDPAVPIAIGLARLTMIVVILAVLYLAGTFDTIVPSIWETTP